MSLAENVEYLRRLRELNGITGFADFHRQSRPAPECPLIEIESFGSNPGRLKMFAYVPAQRQPLAPLVVVLHGCGQGAAEYDLGAGWSTLAKHFGFALLLPEQQRVNNPQRCFNWFQSEDITRDQGEVASIREMIARMVADCAIDPRRIYVTGLSAGGAMTMAMLSAHPELFAAGAIIAGLPFGTARNMRDAILQMRMPPARPAGELGDLVRRASHHRGKWPKLSVWHGTADYTVHPDNAGEIVKQWLDLHHLPLAPMAKTVVDGYPRQQWWNDDGEPIVESYTITNMAHGTPIGIAANDKRYGKAGPFLLEAGISSSYHIAKFFGVTDWIRPLKAASTSPSTKLIPQVSPISAVPALTKILRRAVDAPSPAAEPAEVKPATIKVVEPRVSPTGMLLSAPPSAAVPQPKVEHEQPTSEPRKAAKPRPDQKPESKPAAGSKPAEPKRLEQATVEASINSHGLNGNGINGSGAAAKPRRRTIDVAAVIDRALHAAGLK